MISFSHSPLSPAIRTLPVPTMPMALRFLEPITEPIPPAEWETAFMTFDMGTRFSPAGPMAATTASGPMICEIARVVPRIPWPQRRRASWISTCWSTIDSQTGRSALPLMTIASYPAYFSLAANCSAHVSGRDQGLRPAGRPEGGDGSATVAGNAGPGQRSDGEDDPVVRIVRFCPCGHLVPHHLVAYPGSPRDSPYTALCVSSVQVRPVERSTWSTLPAQPP